MAGHIIEVVTGRSFEEAVRERVLDPLQMRVASFRPTAEVEAQLATAYTGEGFAGFVLMSNEAWDVDAVWQIESELLAYLQRKVKPAAPVPRVDLEPTELEALAGTYVRRNHDIEFERAFRVGTPIVVDVAGRDLRIRCADGRTRRAVPVGGGRFRFSEQTHPSMMFTAAAEYELGLARSSACARHSRSRCWQCSHAIPRHGSSRSIL